jgi:hypothetical protein
MFVLSFFCCLPYFIVSGNPDGFSILWVCFLPACGLLAFGRKAGTLICAGISFWSWSLLLDTQPGQSIVLYEYTPLPSRCAFRCSLLRFILYRCCWRHSAG